MLPLLFPQVLPSAYVPLQPQHYYAYADHQSEENNSEDSENEDKGVVALELRVALAEVVKFVAVDLRDQFAVRAGEAGVVGDLVGLGLVATGLAYVGLSQIGLVLAGDESNERILLLLIHKEVTTALGRHGELSRLIKCLILPEFKELIELVGRDVVVLLARLEERVVDDLYHAQRVLRHVLNGVNLYLQSIRTLNHLHLSPEQSALACPCYLKDGLVTLP